MVLLILACVCAFGMVYSVAVYPPLVLVLARLFPRPWREGEVTEPVAHIVTVHDEEKRIGRKLDNALSLEAPPGGARLVVADDGSTDSTASIVGGYRERGVTWIGCPRRSKENAQIEALRQTDEPILVFSDASTLLAPNAVRQILRPFADPEVAAVSGTDRLAHSEGATGEDIYVRYEMALRRAESLLGSLVGLSGCFFAVRREIAEQFLPDVPSDMSAALISIRASKRAVAQDDALCTYTATSDPEREFARKRRTALRGLRCLVSHAGALGTGSPLLTWQVLSHKWLRFAAPGFALALVSVLVAGTLAGHAWAGLLLVAAALGVAAGLLALQVASLRALRPFRALGFFVLSSLAVIAAWADLLRGRTQVTWSPTTRP